MAKNTEREKLSVWLFKREREYSRDMSSKLAEIVTEYDLTPKNPQAAISLEERVVILTRELHAARLVLGEAYQMAGALGATAEAMDNIIAAAEGKPIPHATFLPHPASTWMDEACDLQDYIKSALHVMDNSEDGWEYERNEVIKILKASIKAADPSEDEVENGEKCGGAVAVESSQVKAS